MTRQANRVEELLIDWEEARLEGRWLSAEQLCVDCPDLVQEVTRKMHVLHDLSWAVDPNAVVDDSVGDIAALSTTTLPDTDITVAEFAEALSGSGVLAPAIDREAKERFSGRNGERALAVASEMVRDGVLTNYQAKVLLERGDSPLLLDRYVILDAIGAGGMGIVFKALQRSLERVVAVKVLPRHFVDSPEKVERFQREMRAAAKLSHPNVVQAFDAYESGGVYFFAMEYVNGSDLAAFVQQHGPRSAAEACDIIAQVAAGLQCAHANGIVHRDVKPSNILLSRDGVAKVLDLGLARARDVLQTGAFSELTQDGLAMGTVTYMSPEQAFDARDADQRSDIYSLGCTLYYLLHGRPMFDHANSVQVVVAHRERPAPRLGESREDVSDALEQLFQELVAKQPDARPVSMQEVEVRLRALIQGEPSPAPQPPATSPIIITDDSGGEHHDSSRRDWWLRSLLGCAFGAIVVMVMVRFLFPDSNVKVAQYDAREVTTKLISEFEDLTITAVTDDEMLLTIDVPEDIPDQPFEIFDVTVWTDGPTNLNRFQTFPLQRLTISLDGANFESLPIDLTDLEKLGHLNELTLEGVELDEKGLSQIGGCSSLTMLQLSECDLPLGKLSKLSKLRRLRDLSVWQDELRDGDLAWIAKLQSLEFLDVSGTRITTALLEKMRGMPALTTLMLTGVELEGNLEALSALPKLGELYVDGTDLTDEDVEFLAQLPLRALDVSHTTLSDQGVRSLSKIQTLEQLWLTGLPVMQAIDQIVQLPSLHSLDVSRTDFEDAGLEKLSKMSSLSILNVKKTGVTSASIERFELRTPWCEVIARVQQRN